MTILETKEESVNLRSAARLICLATCICMSTITYADDLGVKQDSSTNPWVALISLRTYPHDKDKLIGGTPLSQTGALKRNAYERPVWTTIAISSRGNNSLQGIYTVDNNGLARFEQKTYVLNRPNGHHKQYKIRVQELCLRSLRSGKSMMLLGAKQIREAKAQELAPNTNASYEGFNRIAAIYGPWIGVSSGVFQYQEGNGYPNNIGSWQTYCLKAGRLVPTAVPLPRSAKSSLLAQRSKFFGGQLTEEAKIDRGTLVSPCGSGVFIESGVGPATASHDDVQQEAVCRVSSTLLKNSERVRKEFVAAHPKLIPWTRTSFYAVAPDGSGVVYATGNTLHWLNATGQGIAGVQFHGDIRGLQWINASKLSNSESNLLYTQQEHSP